MHLNITGSVTLSQIFVRGVRGSTDSLVLFDFFVPFYFIEYYKWINYMRLLHQRIYSKEVPDVTTYESVHIIGIFLECASKVYFRVIAQILAFRRD